MKPASPPNQSTSQTPPDSEATRRLPDPGATQRIAWTPPNTPLRLTVTPGGGPQPDPRDRRDVLRGVAAVLLTLLLLGRLPLSRSEAKAPVVSPPVASRLAQQAAFAPPPRPPLRRRTGSDPPVRLYLVAPSVPLPPDD